MAKKPSSTFLEYMKRALVCGATGADEEDPEIEEKDAYVKVNWRSSSLVKFSANVAFAASSSHKKPIDVTKENGREILGKYDYLILDCDGVLGGVNQMTEFEGIKRALGKLSKNKKMYFLSNNSLHNRESLHAKITEKYGMDIPKERVYCVSYTIAKYLKEKCHLTGLVYVIGRHELANEISSFGIKTFGTGPDEDMTPMKPEDLAKLERKDNVDAVVVGFDSEFDYKKLCKASNYLTNPKCHFVATCDNAFVKMTSQLGAPVDGALVAAVSSAAQRQPTIVGKPYPYIFECIKQENPDIKPGKTLVIGDNIATDVTFAKNCKMDSLLVLTGLTTESGIHNAQSTGLQLSQCGMSVSMPKYVAKSICEICEDL